ncbi:LPS-assembly protein LptD [soil metagenome]
MTRIPVFSHSYQLISALTIVVTAVSLPTFAIAQTAAKPGASSEDEAPATLNAEQMTGRPDREVTLERKVEITRGSMVVNADKATYNVVEDQVDASGQVRMLRQGDRYTGEALRLKMDVGQGFVTYPTYHLGRNHAQGQAALIEFESEERATITDGTYSTCEGPDPDWYLKSSTLRLDRGRDIGNSTSTVVYFKGFPILGAPAMSFPLSDARKSGILPPIYGPTSNGGLEISVPYYFNIAPNRDLTLYPKLITKRGLQLGAEGRYLEPAFAGETRLEFLPNDQQTKTNRYAVSSTHSQMLAPRLGMAWNLNAASDDDYPNDFSHTITAASQRLLLRDLNLNYAGSMWNMNARASNYQVLQDPLAPIIRPYDRLPQIGLQAGRQDVMGFDWTFDSELTRFWHPDLVRGERVVLNPKISYPIIRPGYFITPKFSFDLTKYHLANKPDGTPSNLSRALPTFSLDSGLVFERDASFFGRAMTQTLEPRLFYVKTPYRDQSQFPIFDTAEADLSFSQLFSENRFIGHDRISDANQLTVAMTSRFIEASGEERMRFALGQRFYFSEQQVGLATTIKQGRSDLLLAAAGKLSPALSVDGNIQFSEDSRSVYRANYGVRWQPAPMKVLNLTYRRDLLNSLEQLDVSGQWPIDKRWYGVGRINYSLPNSQIVEGLLGLEYKADCWVFRVVAQRTPTATDKATSSMFFQLELNGLTRLGPNPLDALRSNIPGYQKINTPGSSTN